MKTIVSVTCFLHHKRQWLFIHRTKKGHSSDFGKLNGIGGKVEANEDALSAAIRETTEETGFILPAHCFQQKAKVMLSGGYPDKWDMTFFRVEAPTRVIPAGMENDEGNLIWIEEDQVLHSTVPLVDDIHYCFDHIRSADTRILNVEATADENELICQWRAHWSKKF